MRWQNLRRKLLILSLLLFVGYAIFAIVGITYSPNVPRSITVSEKYNLCLDFRYNSGSGENMLLFTHWCNVTLKYNELFDSPAPGSYLDERTTMECPQYEIADKDKDGTSEFYITQNWPCKEFAHPWDNDAKQLAFTFASDGKFVDLSR